LTHCVGATARTEVDHLIAPADDHRLRAAPALSDQLDATHIKLSGSITALAIGRAVRSLIGASIATHHIKRLITLRHSVSATAQARSLTDEFLLARLTLLYALTALALRISVTPSTIHRLTAWRTRLAPDHEDPARAPSLIAALPIEHFRLRTDGPHILFDVHILIIDQIVLRLDALI
jgi:hypothetical protein